MGFGVKEEEGEGDILHHKIVDCHANEKRKQIAYAGGVMWVHMFLNVACQDISMLLLQQ